MDSQELLCEQFLRFGKQSPQTGFHPTAEIVITRVLLKIAQVTPCMKRTRLGTTGTLQVADFQKEWRSDSN